MKNVVAVIAVAACVGGGWLVYQDSLRRSASSAASRERTVEPVAVHVTRVQRRPIEDQILLVGSLEPAREVQVRSRVSGYVARLPFDVGDFVVDGQVVVELDDSKYQELVTHSEAALEVAKAQLAAKQAQKDLSEREIKRLTELAKSGVVTEQQSEQMRAQTDIALAEVELEQARVNQAQSELLSAKLALRELQLVAPFSGHLADRFVERGDLAHPDDLLIRLVDDSKVRTIVHIVEKDYEKVQLGQVATVQVDAYPGRKFTGKVARKSPVLDAETRTAAVQIEIENAKFELKAGMHARVQIVFNTREDASVVPIASLIQHDQKSAIFVVEGNPPTTKLHEVQVGIEDGRTVEILSGVRPTDRVVTLGSRLVKHGQEVVPVEVPWSAVEFDATAAPSSVITGE